MSSIGIRVEYDQGAFARITRRLSEINRKLLAGQTTETVADWLKERVATYPKYVYVSRREAYGVPFFTVRQRRWFFAALKSGELTLPYQRTNALADAWRVEKEGNSYTLTNDTPYARHVMGAQSQSRMSDKIGWRTTQDIVKYYSYEIGRVGIKALHDVIEETA